MSKPVYNVLFLCNRNAARGILAEALLNHKAAGRFHAWSAGSQPSGQVNAHALDALVRLGIPTTGLRSKSWDEFEQPGAPQFDFVITVCDTARDEVCPIWPGQPVTAHWSVVDPARAEGPAAETAFRDALVTLQRRIDLFLSIPLASLDRLAVHERVSEIGQA